MTEGAKDQFATSLEINRAPARPSVTGVEIAALFRETRKPGETKVSLRSKGPLPVNGIMIAHGGGGHPPAAGCTMKASVEESREVILAEVEALLDDAD